MTTPTKLSRRASIAVFLGGLTFAARAFAQQPQPNQPRPLPVPPNVLRDRRLLLEETDRALVQARDALFRAGHEYGGHRARAIQYINAALTETNVARGFLG